MWDVKSFDDITPDSLALLDLVEPPPEVVIVGCGSRIRQLPPTLTQHLRARGIAVEALDTVCAGGGVQLTTCQQTGWGICLCATARLSARERGRARTAACMHCI
jgi:hypothetical protein